mgnify:FL=1
MFAVARGLRVLDMVIEDTIEYTGQRQVFDIPVRDNQVVYHKLAELHTEVEACRAVLYQAAERYLAGEDVTKLASMGKYMIGKLALKVPTECMQFWGGQGVMNENYVSRAYRDMRVTAIGGGASEIMLEVIAKSMGIHPGKRSKR